MDKTLNQYKDSVKEKITNFHVNDDFRIDDVWIKDELVMKNNSLIREEVITNKSLPDRYYTFYNNISITKDYLGSTVINNISTKPKKYYMTSLLPPLLNRVGWKDIKYLGNPDLDYGGMYTRKTLDGFLSSEGNRWTNDKPMYVVMGNKVYYKNIDYDGSRLAQGMLLLKDARDSKNWNNDDSILYTPSSNKLELLVVKEILSLFEVPIDIINDLNNVIGQQTKTEKNDSKD